MVGRADVPVSIGAARPLQRRLRTAPETHGPTGTGYVELRGEDRKLGSTDYTPIPAPRYLGAHIKRHPGEITILALGPLTNLAAAALNGVDLVDGTRADRAGWAARWRSAATPPTPGSGTPASTRRRPRPACGAVRRPRRFPLDATQDVVFTIEDLRALPETHLAGVVRDAVRFYIGFHREADGIDGCYLHDPVTLIGALLRPDLVERDGIQAPGGLDTGADPYVAGSLFRAGDEDERPPVDIAIALDADGMKEELLARLGRAVAAEVA